MLADFDEMGVRGLLYHVFVPVGCSFLFILVTGRLNRLKRKKKKRAKKLGQPKKDVDS
jgi:hypothetical protein